MKNKTIKSAVAAILAVFVLLFTVACTTSTPTPTPEPTPTPIDETAFHVATNGNDESDGTINAPFATVEKAISAVKDVIAEGLTKPVTVYVHGGDYSVETIDLSGIKGTAEYPVTFKAYNGEEVILNGGITITLDDFTDITDNDVLARIADSAKGKVKVCDLAKLGLTKEMIGELSATGSFMSLSVSKYNETMRTNVSFFWNDTRMTNARYPETGFLYSTGLVDMGNFVTNKAGTLIIDTDTASRVATWQNLDSVWMFSYPMFKWAENTSPIAVFDAENNTITPKYASVFDYMEQEIPYYFYNVLEELTVPGEYYIDRDNLLLYFYPTDDKNAVGTISVINSDMIIGTNIEYLTLEGITCKGGLCYGFYLSGNNILITDCEFMGLTRAGSISGSGNQIFNCEAHELSKNGFELYGGDRTTLTPGNNIIENCYVHDFGQEYKTYENGITTKGCGNKIIHNEICNAPHSAFSYNGNDHVLEYNYIHDVVLESSDAGALYVGGDWTSCGTVVRYNLFRNIGRDDNACTAIYYDDGMSSGTVIGNIIDNCSGDAILIGGGRDMIIKNNLVISDNSVFFYDARLGTSGDIENSWLSIYWKTAPGEGMWAGLASVSYLSELWAERYPNLALITTDYERYRDPEFPGNPAYSVVKDNVFIGKTALDYEDNIDADVFEYSEIGSNVTITSKVDVIEDGTYTVINSKLNMYKVLYGIEYEQIPYDQIGRYGVGING